MLYDMLTHRMPKRIYRYLRPAAFLAHVSAHAPHASHDISYSVGHISLPSTRCVPGTRIGACAARVALLSARLACRSSSALHRSSRNATGPPPAPLTSVGSVHTPHTPSASAASPDPRPAAFADLQRARLGDGSLRPGVQASSSADASPVPLLLRCTTLGSSRSPAL